MGGQWSYSLEKHWAVVRPSWIRIFRAPNLESTSIDTTPSIFRILCLYRPALDENATRSDPRNLRNDLRIVSRILGNSHKMISWVDLKHSKIFSETAKTTVKSNAGSQHRLFPKILRNNPRIDSFFQHVGRFCRSPGECPLSAGTGWSDAGLTQCWVGLMLV